METTKKTKEFTILKKRSGRYGVKNAQNNWVKGDEKVKILSAEGLIKLTAPTAKTEEETTSEE